MAEDIKQAIKTSLAKSQGSKPGTMQGMKQADVSDMLTKYKGAIAQALPKHITPERLIQIASSVIAKNPKIAACTQASLIGAVMQASMLGLKPIQELGHCFFVPYNNKVKDLDGTERWEQQVQFQIGYKGYLELARRSRQVKMLYAEVVREGDVFEYQLGLHPNIKHVPNLDNVNSPVKFAYAVAHYKDGGYNFVVVTRGEVESYRMRNRTQSKDKADGAWATDYASMAKKTAIRRLTPYLPLETDDALSRSIHSDEAIINVEDYAKDGSGEITEPLTEIDTVVVDSESGEIIQPAMFEGEPGDYETMPDGSVGKKRKASAKAEVDAYRD